MPSYEIGITEINTQVRRLGYASAILTILGNKTLSEFLLYDRLERWSLEHKSDLENHVNQQGQIKPTLRKTGAKRYTEFVVALGLIGQIAGAYRVTRFGKTIVAFLNHETSNSFELGTAERYSYLYWLFIKDSDRLLTVLDMLAKECNQPLGVLQSNFQDHYLNRLDVRLSAETGRVAREILSVRNRVAYEWKTPKRYAENIVPPRIHWLVDLGLAYILDSRGKPSGLTEAGKQLLLELPKLPGTDLAYVTPSWCQHHFFSSVGPILVQGNGRQWRDLTKSDKIQYLRILISQAFNTLRSSPVPMLSLYPTLIYMALFLATEEEIWGDLEELHKELDDYASEADASYKVRFSHRENEAYLISLPR